MDLPRLRLPRTLSYAEVMELLASVQGARPRAILYILFYAGLRNNEVRMLNIEDIDYINREILVRQGKGRKDRKVPIPTELVLMLQTFCDEKKEGFLFPGNDAAGRISTVEIRRIVKRAAEAAAIRNYKEVHPHTLRHSYATFLRNRGVSLDVIQTTLGHVRADTTMIYSKLALETIKQEIEKAFWA